MLALIVVCALATAAWVYLLTLHGGFWRTDQRLPPVAGPPSAWPPVSAIIPARNEASGLPGSLPSLLSQDYPGPMAIVVVDDQSSDGTGDVAARLGHEARGHPLVVMTGSPPPPGWAGKVWAMAQGTEVAGNAEYLLYTDADIAYAHQTVTTLVAAAEGARLDLVSQMARLRTDTGWERMLVPAFVYFFAQLYPFRRVNRRGGRTAAAAGGCMLVRRTALERAGGLARIRGARIDDVALSRLLKRGAGAACWLGLTTAVTSTRPYDRFADLWDMVARSAYTQLRYSPVLLAGTVLGLAWLYLLPPAAGLTGLALLAAGVAGGGWLAGLGLAGWALMALTFVPMLRLYRLSPSRAVTLPVIAALYAGMTADSARRHHAGHGGEWKGRTIQDTTAQPDATQETARQPGTT